MALDNLGDKILGIFKPLEKITYEYYDNDYMIFLLLGLVILVIVGFGFLVFKIVMYFVG